MTEDIDRLNAALAGRYRIERELGSGGMATVYLADDLKHERKVAVKILRSDLTAALGTQRFLREIQTTAKLRHPGVLPLYDSGEAAGFLFYIMPVVEGESLRARLEREGQLPVQDAVAIAREVAEALSHAHSQGILHRDVKPENILLEGGHAILADFGISRAVDAASDENLTGTGLSVGTPSYASPEQALGDSRLDERTDLYALGCVLFEMLAGDPPFTAATPLALIARRLSTTAPAVSSLRDTVSPQLDGLVHRLLAKAPADRPGSAKEVVAELDAPGILDRTTAGAHADGPGAGRAVQPIAASPAWRTLATRALVTVVAVVVALIGTRAIRNASAPAPAGLTADLLAVVPFRVNATSDYAYLGNGIVDLMSVKLDGVGGLRVVNPRAVISLVGDQQIDVDDPEAGRRIAESLGAARFVVGSITEVGGRLQISAGLHETANSDAPIVTVTDAEAPDRLFELIDSLAISLFAGTLGDSATRMERLATVTTSSLPALTEYLRGEHYIRAGGQFREAEAAFERAIAIDTTFALAYYRKSLVGDWTDAYDVRSSADRAFAYADRFTARDRSLMAALHTRRHGRSDEAESMYRAHLVRWPDEVEALTQLGEILFHDGPRRGKSMTDAIPFYERALELEPANVDARVHVARLHALNGDLERLRDDVSQFEHHALDASDPAEEDGGERLFEVQAIAAFAGSDTAAQRDIARRLVDKPWYYWFYATHGISRFAREPGAAQDLLEARSSHEPLVEMIAANLYLVRGQLAAFRNFIRIEPTPAQSQWDVLEAFVWTSGATEADTARMAILIDRLRNADPVEYQRNSWVPAYEDLTVPFHAFELDYMVALLQIQLGRFAEARRTVASLRTVEPFEALGNYADDVIRSLEAEMLFRQGDAPGALEILRAITYETPHASTYHVSADGSRSRFLQAELELEHGDTAVAVALYRGFDESWSPWDMYHRPVVYQRLGEIGEARGDTDGAIRYYSWLIDLWRAAEPYLADRREAIRQRLDELVASRG